MPDSVEVTQKSPPRVPWNKGKLIGAKPPLRSKHVWSIRTRLQVEGRTRDLAMFNLAIDSKLRGCDVIAIKVEDVAPHGYTADRATVRQKKTGRPVRFELTDQSRMAIDEYLIPTPHDYFLWGASALRRGHQWKSVLAQIMSCCWLSATQRSPTAWSRSSMVSKWRLTSRSSTNAQRCSAGCSSGL